MGLDSSLPLVTLGHTCSCSNSNNSISSTPQQPNVARKSTDHWLISLRSRDHISQEGPWVLSSSASLFLWSATFPSYRTSYPLSETPYSQLTVWDDLIAYFTKSWILKSGLFSFHHHWPTATPFCLLHGVNGLPVSLLWSNKLLESPRSLVF